MLIGLSTALNTGVQPCTDEATDPFADLDEDEQDGDEASQDEEL